jgi:hypothetical protein
MPRTPQKNNQVRNIVNPPLKSTPSVLIQQNKPTLFDSIKQGFGFGIGSSIAQNMFRHQEPTPSVRLQEQTPSYRYQESKIAPAVETNINKEYVKCMQESDNDYEGCKSKLNGAM